MVNFTLIDESMLNTTTHITNLQQASEYVTIKSCKIAMAQTSFWMWTLGILFILSWIAFCYLLHKHLKLKKEIAQNLKKQDKTTGELQQTLK